MTIKELTATCQTLTDIRSLLEQQLRTARQAADELISELSAMTDTNPDLDALADDCDKALDTVALLRDQLMLATNAEGAVQSAINALRLAKAWDIWKEKEG